MSVRACELLPWDSEFFGCRIARLAPGSVDRHQLEAAETWCGAESIDCLYLLLTSRTESEHAAVVERGFMAVDERLTLERPVPAVPEDAPGVRRAELSDIGALRRIASVSHQGTRFYVDPRFRAAADRLYAVWIEKSVRDPAQWVFVPRDGAAAGYISCYQSEPGIGQIGLLAVDAAARGQGLGTRFVRAALAWSHGRSHSRMRVVTQGGNTSAVNLYTRCGFTVTRTEWWYHRWFTPATAR